MWRVLKRSTETGRLVGCVPSLAKEMASLSRTRKAYRSKIVTTTHPLLASIKIIIEVVHPAAVWIDHEVVATILIATQDRVRTPAHQGKQHDDEAAGGGD